MTQADYLNCIHADILARAATMILTDGWCREVRHGDGGTRCAVGAIEDAAEELTGRSYPVSYEATSVLQALIDRRLGHREFGIGTWNDRPDRSAEEVASFLLDAAEEAADAAE